MEVLTLLKSVEIGTIDSESRSEFTATDSWLQLKAAEGIDD
jgi:hypothetical protein